jgi:SAM-dependent methyltransferase
MQCPICSKDVSVGGYDLYDDRYGFPGRFRLATCGACDHRFLPQPFTPDAIKKLYTDYYPRSAYDPSRHRPFRPANAVRSWLKGDYASAWRWVPANVRVLDIGCGSGEALGYHRTRGCDAYGVEADDNVGRVARQFGYNIHLGLFDPDLYAAESFDFVTLDQVLEHIPDPVRLLKGVFQVLKPGGVIVVSTPNTWGWGASIFGRRWIHWHVPYHVQWFSLSSMQRAATLAGLTLVAGRTITRPEWLGYQWMHVLLFPPMGEPSRFWSPKAARTTLVKCLLGTMLLSHYSTVNHVLTKLFDSLGVGDNHLFILRKNQRITG